MVRCAVVILCGLLLLSGCASSQAKQEQVLRVMQVRSRALNERNLPLYLSVVSQSYDDKGKTYAVLRESMEAAFKLYEQVSYRGDDWKVSIDGQRARVTGAYRMKIVIRGREMALDGREGITLAKEADGWKIIAGL